MPLLLGTAVPRVEDERFLTGQGTYIANLDLPGVLTVTYVTSSVAHGLITGIDVEEARQAPGVVDVVTAADLDIGPIPPMNPNYPASMARPILAADRVRFVGEAIVAIVSETAAAGADAAELVVIDYEPLPAVVTIEAAETDDVVMFPEAGTNLVLRTEGGDADPESCEVSVSSVIINQRLAPCPLEGRAGASVWGDDGRLTHWSSCQGAHPVRAVFAQTYGMPVDQIRLIAPDVGGSFGSKARPTAEELLLPFLARRAGRPVRWVPSRSTDMTGLGHSRGQRQRFTIGGDRDGTMRAMRVHVDGDAGAYPALGPMLAANAATMSAGPYRFESMAWSTAAFITNSTPTVAYRGAGRPEAAALVERAVDLFAAAVGLDPAEVRRRNLVRPDQFPWTTATGVVYDSGRYEEALQRALDEVDYEGVRKEQARRRDNGNGDDGGRALGIGVTTFIDRTAGVPGSEYGAVELRADGSVLVRTGSSPYGQGHHTAWKMLVADRTGLPLDRIEVIHGDTDQVPRGGITGGSRSAQKAGSAVAEATDLLVVEAKRQAANLLEASPDDIVLDMAEGRFHVAGSPGAGAPQVTWSDLGERTVTADGPGLKCETDFDGLGPTVPFGAYVAVVEVDTETGAVEITRMVTVDDAGTILNPLLAMGQVHGGLAQGIGQGLFEEWRFDDDGNPLTANFSDYAFISAADLPSFESYLVETPSPNNPLGFKGIAESGTIGGPPVLQSAVLDALAPLGVRHIDFPLTPERVWEAIQEARRS
ncbi:MAG: xanthine dehydrogenase family protein molybdopterin-binding subunit [Acidobacteria bacterium]|nr:xanthine dehydrogenase family protein molybdopterin-binding subunit [Acidobacteriota bacterium]